MTMQDYPSQRAQYIMATSALYKHK